MTRQQAISVLEIHGEKKLLPQVKDGPLVLGAEMKERIEKLISKAHVRFGFGE